jgi:serine/threonine protein kinase
MTEDLLSFFEKRIPRETTKRILKASLEGIAGLHEGDIVHLGIATTLVSAVNLSRLTLTDIKPDNFMLDYRLDEDTIVVDQVKLTDLENAAHLPKGKAVKGFLAGNDNWRSPEAHFKGELTQPTDIFSFGAVVSRLSGHAMHTNAHSFHSVSMLSSDALSLAQMRIWIVT